ncbi:AraC family transcriptional regulator [Sphingobacterium sp. Mn56C]|uniref:AraC family transcriptional regulator n=1 Tax=Sphingobacterium sp. Mn56C TaxID=3395261 RepID=UPI003BE7EF98
MKPVYAKILEGSEIETFATKEICRPNFSTEFHFHSACQITYIIQSSGKRIIGDSVDRFSTDELTFIGSNLPHVWHNDLKPQQPHEEARSIALYLEPSLFLDSIKKFFNPHKIETFLHLSKRGLLFFGDTKKQLKQKLQEIVAVPYGLKKTTMLFEIIDILIHTEEYIFLSSAGYTNNYRPQDNDKIDRIFKYVFDNYSKDMVLDSVAALSNMSKHAFCRYFKSRTQKTFIQFVNEVRISEACKLLGEDTLQITSIAYHCGFNNLSHFNKIFKAVKGATPREYKLRFLG